MTLLVVVIVAAALASLLILLTGRTGSSQTPPRSPSASASASASPSAIPAASPQQAMRLVQGFAAARVDGQPVDPFVAAAVASAYEHHTHGLSLYRYSGADIVGSYLFLFEPLPHGRY